MSLEGFREGHENADDVSCQSAFFEYYIYVLIIYCCRIWGTFHRFLSSQAYNGHSTMAWPPIPLLVSSIVASLSQHLAQIDNHVQYIMGSISLENL